MTSDYYQKSKTKDRKDPENQTTILYVVVVAIFKALWSLIKLPFKNRNRSKKNIRTEVLSRGQEIETLVLSGNIVELKHAVIEADKLVDYVFQLKGYHGDTFADRLRSAEKHINQATYQAIWESHKIRNRLAHEGGEIPPSELKRAVKNLLDYIYD